MLKLLIIYSNRQNIVPIVDFLSHTFICKAISHDDIVGGHYSFSQIHFNAIVTVSSGLANVLPKSLADVPCVILPLPLIPKDGQNSVFSIEMIERIADNVKNAVTQSIYNSNHHISNLLDTRFFGISQKIAEVKSNIKKFAATNEPVLIIGETGTGKEIAAELLHNLSSRKAKPYIVVNAAGIPDTLAESEFFGVVAGAYTDAISRKGLFQAANNGTLFLDEIESISQNVQTKLLRIIDRRALTPLGTTASESVDVRLITASNSTIEQLKEYCRADFFYRICNLVLFLPPLRERKEDIPFLLNSFQSIPADYPEISVEALDKLMHYDWPGNVRELKACYLRACSLSDDVIKAKHIQFF